MEQLEIGLAEFSVAAPPHRVFGKRVDDNVFVFGAATGMDAGLGAEGTALHERAFAISDRVLHQDGVGQIPMNAGEILETELISAIGAVPHTRFHHLKPPLWPLVPPGYWFVGLIAVSWLPAERPERPAHCLTCHPRQTPARQEHAFWQKCSVAAVTLS
jgi:hypothetical protein